MLAMHSRDEVEIDAGSHWSGAKKVTDDADKVVMLLLGD